MNERIRPAIVGYSRTPFTKINTFLSNYTAYDLGRFVVKGVCQKNLIPGECIEELAFGTVLLDPVYPNLAREIVLKELDPRVTAAHFISNNCITGLVCATAISQSLMIGKIKMGIAGGAESMSNPALTFSRKAQSFFKEIHYAKDLPTKLKTLLHFNPSIIKPVFPSPREPSTGLSMGEHAELSVKGFDIKRADQDLIAYRSHKNAAAAEESGIFADEILSLSSITAPNKVASKDNLIRKDTTMEKLANLQPVFDKTGTGSITAGNASALTDGASAVVLSTEERARELNLAIHGYIVDWQFSSIAPKDGLLMAPFFAVTELLQRNKLTVDDIDIFEIHEAFAAQVCSNLYVWHFGWNKFPDIPAIGEIPLEKINIHGGSIALGHPFAATGARLIASAAKALSVTGGRRALISACAAGGMACAMIIER